jgi:hypothetical protein
MKEASRMPTQTTNRLGFSSAVLVFVFSNTFTIGALAGLPKPLDVYIPIGASLLLSLSFVVMIMAVHYAADDEKKIWSHLGLVFAIMYAALVSIVYVTWIFVVEPHVLRGDSDKVALLVFATGSFLQMVDGFGYTLQMIAALFTAFIFPKDGLGGWIRWAGIANGVFAIPVFISYVSGSIALGLGWVILIPAFSLLLSIYFLRAGKSGQIAAESD